MNHTLRFLFFALVVRPIMTIILGLNVRHRERLAPDGPAVLVANHNSHLDALALMCLFPMRKLHRVRPVARDYFFRYRWLAWFAVRVVGIIPLDRQVKFDGRDPLAGITAALQRGQIVLLFPEGRRGEPEQLGRFKTGVAHLARRRPDVPVTPLFMHGLGKALPRGEALIVPFFLDIFVGEPLRWDGDKTAFMGELTRRMSALAAEVSFPPWH